VALNVTEVNAEETSDARLAMLAEQLSHFLPALWRGVVKLARAARQMPQIEDQVTVLRRVVASDGATPAQLADALHVSRPTISKLVKELVASGMVERRPSDSDGRSVVIVASKKGSHILTEFRRGRVEVLIEAVGRLDQRDRQILELSLPTLANLLDILDLMEEEALSPRQATSG
jgi:DNA-binding MarR family transcriptional regulator